MKSMHGEHVGQLYMLYLQTLCLACKYIFIYTTLPYSRPVLSIIIHGATHHGFQLRCNIAISSSTILCSCLREQSKKGSSIPPMENGGENCQRSGSWWRRSRLSWPNTDVQFLVRVRLQRPWPAARFHPCHPCIHLLFNLSPTLNQLSRTILFPIYLYLCLYLFLNPAMFPWSLNQNFNQYRDK